MGAASEMTLKDDLRADIERVFFDVTELAELHELKHVIVPSTKRRYDALMSGRDRDDYDGLHGDHLEIQFRAEDFTRKEERLPREKERILFDGRWFEVERIEVEYGVARLVMSRYRGRHVV